MTGSSTPREARTLAALLRMTRDADYEKWARRLIECSVRGPSDADVEGSSERIRAALSAAQASSDYPHTDHGCYGATDPRCRARNCVCRCHAQASSEAERLDELRALSEEWAEDMTYEELRGVTRDEASLIVAAVNYVRARLAESRPDWYDTNARLAEAAARLRGESRHDK